MKTKNNKSKLALLGAVFIYAVIFSISCQSNKPEEIQEITNLEEVPSLTITNLETIINDSSIVKYKLKTPELKQYDNTKEHHIDFNQGVDVTIFKNTGEVDASIKANWAKYLPKEKLWELKNDVQAINQKGDKLNTEQLFWDENKQLIYSTLHTKITTKTQILTGIGFESTQNLSEYTFHKPQGIFEIESSN